MYHSIKQPGIFHIFESCTEGNNIEPPNRVEGCGHGRRLCSRCGSMRRTGGPSGSVEALYREIAKARSIFTPQLSSMRVLRRRLRLALEQ